MTPAQTDYFREVIAVLALMRKCTCGSCSLAKRDHLERCYELKGAGS